MPVFCDKVTNHMLIQADEPSCIMTAEQGDQMAAIGTAIAAACRPCACNHAHGACPANSWQPAGRYRDSAALAGTADETLDGGNVQKFDIFSGE